ncbi:MAG: glycoside hydrolase family 25 protein [Chitinophagaceae bacterium]|nr:MAG: glycoside hydrolase family 25 protein [Chitinophagaceae bacterium]
MLFYYTRSSFIGARVHYPEFGIRMPKKYSIHGIDVSRYQKNISWDLVKDMQVRDIRIGFAFMKATEGISILDRSFKRNWRRSGDAGLPRGAYHYFIPGISGEKQAAYFIKNVQLKTGDLPPVLDIEETGGLPSRILVSNLKVWLNRVEQHYGVKPIIYSGAHFYRQYLSGEFEDYPLWIAHYETDSPRIGRSWHFWQHNERGRVDGIDAFVDFNVFAGDSLEFGKLLVR